MLTGVKTHVDRPGFMEEGRLWEGRGVWWKRRGGGGGVHTVVSFYHVRVSAITDIARVPPLHGQQFKHFRLPELPDINWRFVSLWTLSVFQNLTIFTKAIAYQQS